MIAASMLMSTAFAFVGTAVFAENREVVEDESGTWTVMAYVCGDNNLETFALSDLEEMEQVGSKNGVTIVVLMDTFSLLEGTHWYVVEEGSDHVDIDAGTHTCDCHEVTGEDCPGELDMGDGNTLTSFIVSAVEYSPADHYMLVLWDHGGGWRGVCWDDSTVINEMGWYSRLTTPETADAIEAAQDEIREEIDPEFKITIIGYDACLNGMIEVVYENRNIADYMFASINLVPVDGMAYHLFLAEMTKSPRPSIEDIGKAVVDSYVEYYSDWNSPTGLGLEYFADATLSFFRLGEPVTNLVSNIDALARELILEGYLEEGSYRGAISSAESQTPRIPTYSGEHFPFIDLGLYAESLGENIPELEGLTNAIVAGVDEVVVYENHVSNPGGGILRTSGISVMFTWSFEYLNPAYGYEEYEDAEPTGNTLYYGMAFVIDTWWDEFVFTFCQAYVGEIDLD